MIAVLGGVSLAITFTVSAAAQKHSKAAPPAAPSRPDLKPKLVPGEVMRYQIEFQTTSDTKSGGAIQDPQGPSRITIVWDARVRLEVLRGPGGSSDPDNAGPPGVKGGQNVSGAKPTGANSDGANTAGANAADANAVRLRTTYEQSTATVQSDTPDPQADVIVKQYTQLEGRSIEFALDADGRVSAVHGLESILSGQNAVNAAQQWMTQLSAAGSSLPATGIVPGVTWSSEQTADTVPLPGLAWRTDSTYLRDEPCHPAPPTGAPANGPEDTCAVILMRLTLTPAHAKRDAAPDEFRRNGLQATGTWTGSGDSLSYVSLRTGWVVSTSQSGTQEMDVNIANSLGTSVHYGGTVQTHSQISLLPPENSPAH